MPDAPPAAGELQDRLELLLAHRRWKRSHGGSLIGNVAVAAIAGGITGSQVAVVVFIALAVVVTLARRRDRGAGT